MIAFMPQIYPDELFYSWICRYYIHSGSFSHKSVRNDFYCKKSDNISKEFIGNLNQHAKEVLSAMYPMEELILKHTMFPQYARFLSSDRKKEALYHLQYDYKDMHSLFPVLTRGSKDRYLKYCPVCASRDRIEYGEAYWHRSHQIRGIGICINHKCKLLTSSVPVKSEQSFTFCPAESIIAETGADEKINPDELTYCRYLSDVFHAPFNIAENSPVNNLIYRALTKTQYMSATGSMLKTKLLSDNIKDFYTKMGISEIISFSQIQRTLLESRNDFSSICQLAYFIGISANSLTAQCSKKASVVKRSNPSPKDWRRTDEILAPKLRKLAYDIYNGNLNDLGRPDIVSERKIYKLLNLPCHSLEKLPECRLILKSFSETYDELWARRIIWAYNSLNGRGIHVICRSNLRALSGVKTANIDAVIPPLEQLTDSLTARSILKILRRK